MASKKRDVDFSDSDYSDDEPVKKRNTRKANTSAGKRKKTSPRRQSPKKLQTTSALTADPLLDGGRNNSDSDEELEPRLEIDEDNLLNIRVPPLPAPCMSADGKGARLMIKDIMVTNFKSYYGKQRIGPFHTNYTAIVGPNGSGKSNVIDSLLFVFGYKASKIRSKKLSVLIHSSAGRDDIQSCSVEVHFQKIIDKPSGGFDVVPNSQFFVSRTAFKDNSSKYSFNGKTVSLKEVALKLKDVGIDLVHNRFLILQGEVEQIAMMKPKADDKGGDGMLEYLEDIIGTSRYKSAIQMVKNKVDSLVEEIQNQARRLTYAANEKEQLEGPVREMLELMRQENQIAIHKDQLALKNRFVYSRELTTLQDNELAEAVHDKEEAESQMKDVLSKLKDQKDQFGKLEKEKTKAQAELDRVAESVRSEEQREQKRKNDMKRFVKDIEKMETDLEKETKKISDIEQIPAKSEKKIETQKKLIEEMNDQERDAQERLDENQVEYKERTEKDRELKTTCEEEYGTANQKAVALKGEAENLRLELKGFTEKVNRAEKQVEGTKGALENTRKLLEEKEVELNEKQSELPEKEKELQECRDKVAQLKRDDETLSREIGALRNNINEEERRTKGSVGSGLVKALMKAKHDGTIPGILGRLGDLGGIDAKYDVAASTATSAWDYIVVQDVKTANACFDLCRQERLGVVNVIILEKIKDLEAQMNVRRQYPENLPRIFDLIKIKDEKLKTAFYFATRDTLIADNTEQASRVSRGNGRGPRHRVVTLQGAVFETSGTMSGGGKPRGGRIGKDATVDTNRDSRKLMDEWNAELAQKEPQLRKIKSDIRETDDKIRTLSDRVKTLMDAIRKLTNDAKNASTTLETQKRNLVNFEKQLDTEKKNVDEDRMKELQERIDSADREHEKAQAIAEKAKKKVAEVDERLDEVRKQLLTMYEEAIEEARKKRQAAETVVSKEQANKLQQSRNLKKAEQRKTEIERDIEERKDDLEELKNGEETSGAEIAKLKEKKANLEAKIKEAEDNLKELRQTNSSLDKEEVELQKKMKEFAEKVANCKASIAGVKAKLKKIDEERGKISTHDIASLKIDATKMGEAEEIARARKELMDIDSDERAMRVDGGAAARMNELPGERADYFFDRVQLVDDAMERKHARLKEECEKKRSELLDRIEAYERDRTVRLAQEATTPIMTGELPEYTEEEVEAFDVDDLNFRIKTLEQRVLNGKGKMNLQIVDEYKLKVEKYERELNAVSDLNAKKKAHELKELDLMDERLCEFLASFNDIKEYVKTLYQMLTIGGNAQLELKDLMRPFEHGVQFMVRPPKKSWKRIQNLSGGEKTLSSLALVFALHKFRPTPLYVMDEIDAALDFRNVSIIGHYVKDRTKNAQFVIISLRNNMFELCNRLVGIYKIHDCTRHIVVEPNGVMTTVQPLKNAIKHMNNKGNKELSDVRGRQSGERKTEEDAEKRESEKANAEAEEDTKPVVPSLRTKKRLSNSSPDTKPRPAKRVNTEQGNEED